MSRAIFLCKRSIKTDEKVVEIHGENSFEARLYIGPTEVEDTVGELHALEQLLIQDTLVTHLPPALEKCINLKSLRLIVNPKLESFPGAIFENLGILFVEQCPKLNIDFARYRTDNLCHLTLSRCNFESLPEDFGYFPTLESLCLSENKLEALPVALRFAKSLKHINLAENGVRDFDETLIHAWTKLKTLHAPGNRLTEKTLENLPVSIQTINMDRNEVSHLSGCLIKLTNLENISVRKNFISRVDTQVLGITRLRVLNLDDNPLEDLVFANEVRTGDQQLKQNPQGSTLLHLAEERYCR